MQWFRVLKQASYETLKQDSSEALRFLAECRKVLLDRAGDLPANQAATMREGLGDEEESADGVDTADVCGIDTDGSELDDHDGTAQVAPSAERVGQSAAVGDGTAATARVGDSEERRGGASAEHGDESEAQGAGTSSTGRRESGTRHEVAPTPDTLLVALRNLVDERNRLRSQRGAPPEDNSAEARAETAGLAAASSSSSAVGAGVTEGTEGAATSSSIAAVRLELAAAKETIQQLKSQNEVLRQQGRANSPVSVSSATSPTAATAAIGVVSPASSTGGGAPPVPREVMVPTVQLRSVEDIPAREGESALDLCRRRMGLVRDAIVASRQETERLERMLQQESQRLTELGGDASEFGSVLSARGDGGGASNQAALRLSVGDSESKGDDSRDSVTAPIPEKSAAMQRLDLEYRKAQTLEMAGRLGEADKQYRMVLKMQRELPGGNDIDEIVILRDIGRVLASQKLFHVAEPFFSKAASLCEQRLGMGHVHTACVLTDLATVLREQAKYPEAEEATRDSVDALRESVGENDVSVGTALYNLACLLKHQGKYDDADDAFAHALDVFESCSEPCDAEVADTLFQRGSLYRRKREFSAALDDFTQAAELYAAVYGKRDRRVLEAERRANAVAERGMLTLASTAAAPAAAAPSPPPRGVASGIAR